MYLYSSTIGSVTKNYRICGGKQVYCDGICTKCSQAEVLYSNKNQTTADCCSIHIVRRPR